MPIVTRHSTITVVVLAVASVLILGLFTWSGIYNIGADATHTRPVYSMLQMMRERSIAARSWMLFPARGWPTSPPANRAAIALT